MSSKNLKSSNSTSDSCGGCNNSCKSSLVSRRDSKVPVWKKLAYAVGAMPYAMCTTIIALYFNIFLLEVVLLDPVYVLIIVFSGRVWDAITDPVVGYLTSFTRTRLGRLRPWMAMATLPAGLFYFLLWFSYMDGWPDYAKIIYYLICYLVFNSLLTCLHVPYVSLTMHMSEDTKERDSITSYRIGFELISTLLGVGIYTLFFFSLVHAEDSDCDSGNRVVDPNLRAAYQWHALTVAAVIIICVSITVIFIREAQDEMEKSKKVSFRQGLKETLGFKPYFYLLMINIFSWLGFQFIQSNIALYIKYSVGLEDQYPYVIAVVLVTAVIWTFFWQFFIIKFGKKTAMTVGMWITLPTLIVLLFGNYFKMGAYAVAVILSFGLSCAYLIPWSMLPDVINEAALYSPVRREEIFCAFFVFGNKLAGGLTLAISTAIYKIAGYDENACEQPWNVNLTFKLLVTVPPIFAILISLGFLWFYPITKKSIEVTAQILAERRSSPSYDEKKDSKF